MSMQETAAPARHILALPDGGISYLEWRAQDDISRPPLHFAHANGFNGQTYQPALSRLADTFHIRAWDARGHGATTLPANPATLRDWYIYRDDLIRMIENFASETGQKIILAGHSMGGAASIMAASERPDLVRGLVLFDPVMVPRKFHYLARIWQMLGLKGGPTALADGAEKRRAIFPDAASIIERYQGRGAFRTWQPEFLPAYVEGGTRPTKDGQIELSCAPAWEAANFRAHGHHMARAVRKLSVKLAVLRAEHASTCRQPFPAMLKMRDPGAHIETIKGATHFLPMESPDLVEKEVRAFHARLLREEG